MIESKIDVVNPGFLKKYFDRDKKHQPINMGDILISYMTEDSENKIEAQNWKGLDGNIANEKLRELLYRSDFWTQRQNAAKWFGTCGEIFVGIIIVDDLEYISFFRPNNYTKFKTDIFEITAYADKQLQTKNGECEIMYGWRFGKENEINPKTKESLQGRILRETFYVSKGLKNEIEIMETFIYPKKYNKIPGKLIRNNAKSLPDWIKAGSILYEMNLMSNDMGVEWENIKTMWSSKGQFGNGKSANSREKRISNGETRVPDNTSSMNANYAQQFDLLISGSSSIQVLIQSLAYLEDRALKYNFQGRDLESTGSNKHGMQVGLFSQAHSEYVSKKKKQREKDYMRFFKDIVEGILGIKAPREIAIQDSAYEQGKKDAMLQIKAQAEYNKAQAQAQKEQAKKHKADVLKIMEETKKLSQEEEVKVVEKNKE